MRKLDKDRSECDPQATLSLWRTVSQRETEKSGDDTAIALLAQVAVETVTVRTGFIGEDDLPRLGSEPTDQFVDIRRTEADRADVDSLGSGFIRHVGDGDELLVHIETDE